MGKNNVLIVSVLFAVIYLFTGVAHGEVEIVINVPAFALYLYEQGIQIQSFPISVGNELKPSVLGKTSIINNVVDPTYYPPDAAARGLKPIPPGPENPVGSRWLGLDISGYGIHGTNAPGSIGSAASAGCIRMLNEDVEKLSNLVRVGTSVDIVYQTVLLQEDPLLHTKTITVYPDLYNLGTGYEQLLKELELKGWDGVFWPIINKIMQASTGKPHPMAWVVPLWFNGEETEYKAVEVNNTYYLPFDFFLDPKPEYFSEVKKWGDQYFLPMGIYEKLTGFKYSKAQDSLNLHSPQIYVGEIHLGKALIYCGEIYINPIDLNSNLIPEKTEVLCFRGDFYLPASRLQERFPRGELRLEWIEDETIN